MSSPGLRPHPRFPRYLVGGDGTVVGPSGRTLRQFADRDGYLRINVYEDRKWTQLAVHAMVCETYRGARPAGAHVGHRDGNPSNNALSNLRWVTPKRNERDKRGHGRMLLGERHHRAKLTESDVRRIRALRAAGAKLRALAEIFGVTDATISSIAKRQTWRHVR